MGIDAIMLIVVLYSCALVWFAVFMYLLWPWHIWVHVDLYWSSVARLLALSSRRSFFSSRIQLRQSFRSYQRLFWRCVAHRQNGSVDIFGFVLSKACWFYTSFELFLSLTWYTIIVTGQLYIVFTAFFIWQTRSHELKGFDKTNGMFQKALEVFLNIMWGELHIWLQSLFLWYWTDHWEYVLDGYLLVVIEDLFQPMMAKAVLRVGKRIFQPCSGDLILQTGVNILLNVLFKLLENDNLFRIHSVTVQRETDLLAYQQVVSSAPLTNLRAINGSKNSTLTLELRSTWQLAQFMLICMTAFESAITLF